MLEKLKPLNASFMSRKDACLGDCCCWGAGCIPPKEPCDEWDCCCGCCGRGEEAYSDKIDCFKSGRDWDPVLGVALVGRIGGDTASPKKSNPRRESAGLVCLGGAGSALDVVLDGTGAADVALRGDSMSSVNKSCCGALLTCDGPGLGAGPDKAFWDVDLSILCFSFTKFKGISSSPSASSVDGSGIGPSMTHLFDSYFVLIKFSILASEGTCAGASFASQYLFALEFPHFKTLCNCSSVHASRSTDLTLLICVPIPRCIPEHLMQTNMPRFQLAHLGS